MVPTVVVPPHAPVKSVLVPSKLHEKYVTISLDGMIIVLDLTVEVFSVIRD